MNKAQELAEIAIARQTQMVLEREQAAKDAETSYEYTYIIRMLEEGAKKNGDTFFNTGKSLKPVTKDALINNGFLIMSNYEYHDIVYISLCPNNEVKNDS